MLLVIPEGLLRRVVKLEIDNMGNLVNPIAPSWTEYKLHTMKCGELQSLGFKENSDMLSQRKTSQIKLTMKKLLLNSHT